MSYQCFTCPTRPKFSTIQAFRSHGETSQYHSPWPYCSPCSRKFVSDSALDAHLFDYHRPSKRTRYTIDSAGQVRYHTTPTAPDVSQFHCCDCDRDFCDEMSLNQHLRDKVHEKQPAALVGFICKPCGRSFRDSRALSQHMNSVRHKPLVEELKCVTGGHCERGFTSPSAMLHHLESGSCPSGLYRRKINRLIREKDVGGIITSQADGPGGIISDGEDSSSSDSWSFDDDGSEVSSPGSDRSGVLVHTPNSSTQGGGTVALFSSPGGALTPVSDGQLSIGMEVLSLAEGERKCPLCPATRTRTFGSSGALLQHLNSVAHAPPVFHCPLTLAAEGKGDMKEFTTLSGMTQHLESGACKGGKKTFMKAVLFVNEKLRELGFADMKLIT